MREKKLWSLLLIAVTIVLLSFPSDPLAKETKEKNTTVTMKTPDGKIQVYTRKEEVKFKGVKRELPVGSQDWRKTLCRSGTADEQLSATEAQIELDTMINELNGLKKPRQLSEYQKDFLSTVPPCTPYIVKLRIISRLLKGFDLIGISHK